MIGLLSMFFAVIILAMIYSFRIYHWFVKTQEPMFYSSYTPKLEVNQYRLVELKTTLKYTEWKEFERAGHLIHPSNFSENLVRDIEHKQYLLKKQAQDLTDNMLAQGLIEIEDLPTPPWESPYVKSTLLRIRAYKPD